MANRSGRHELLACAILLLTSSLIPGPVFGQTQNSSQAGCITSVNQAIGKVATGQQRQISGCPSSCALEHVAPRGDRRLDAVAEIAQRGLREDRRRDLQRGGDDDRRHRVDENVAQHEAAVACAEGTPAPRSPPISCSRTGECRTPPAPVRFGAAHLVS